MPAKESTAALLLLLIVGDLTALWVYRREPDLKMLVRLIPSVMGGVVIGTIFFATVGGEVVRGTIGIILLALVRSEEHTSELQSRGHLVCRLLLEKKKNIHH